MTCHYFQTTGNSYFLKSLTHCSFSSKFTDEGERYLKYSWCHPSVVPSVLLSHLWKTQLFVLWGFFPSKLLQMSLFLSSNIKYNSWAVQIQLSSNFHMTWVCTWDFLLFPRTKLLPIPGPFDLCCTFYFSTIRTGPATWCLHILYQQQSPAHLTTLPGSFLTFPSSQTPQQGSSVPGCPCSTAIHSEAGEELQLLKEKQPPLSHQVFSLFESENSKTTKAPQVFILLQISIFLSPYAKFSSLSKRFEAAGLFFMLCCLMSDNIHNTEKFVPKISLLMSF